MMKKIKETDNEVRKDSPQEPTSDGLKNEVPKKKRGRRARAATKGRINIYMI